MRARSIHDAIIAEFGELSLDERSDIEISRGEVGITDEAHMRAEDSIEFTELSAAIDNPVEV